MTYQKEMERLLNRITKLEEENMKLKERLELSKSISRTQGISLAKYAHSNKELERQHEDTLKILNEIEQKGFVDDGYLCKTEIVFDHNQPRKIIIFDLKDWKRLRAVLEGKEVI